MVMSDEGQRRIQAVEHDLRSLQEAMYGDKDYVGLTTRVKVLEERLQIFWWALAIVGSAAITSIVSLLMRKFGA